MDSGENKMSDIKKKVMFSGVQPSGSLCIGNYAGALRNWVYLQHTYDCLFVIVDLHALTVKQDPAMLLERSYQFAALYLACGIDPAVATVFIQSHVPAHTQLAWILNCNTYMGELNRMTQYKEKSRQHSENINAGLFSYPVLMAADILLYRTDLVPVGDDQKQHVELTRDIAQRFNRRYGDIFTIPEPYIPAVGARIMGLQNPESKMSKSDENLNNIIALLDPPKIIREKITSSVSDSGREVRFDQQEKPGISNLMTIYSTVAGETLQTIQDRFTGKGYAIFKNDLADVIIECLKPIQKAYHNVMRDRGELNRMLSDGACRARDRSKDSIDRVYASLGFIPGQRLVNTLTT